LFFLPTWHLFFLQSHKDSDWGHDEGELKLRKSSLVPAVLFIAGIVHGQAPITVAVGTAHPEFRVPNDFVGLGFETKSVLRNAYGVHGYFFSPENTQLITLFRNTGVKHIRVGGGTVDGSGTGERCATPIPTHEDIDNLFDFARAADIKVIYSLRLLNVSGCANPHLAEDDAEIAQYIWKKYRANLDSFSIGNEPDVREYHSHADYVLDPAIRETTPGVAGSAYPSYLADWRHFAAVIHKAVPGARFSGPDTAVSSTSSFTPDPSSGVSWTQQFVEDLKDSGLLVEALQHHYVWGSPGNTTAQEAIDDMLASAWDDDTTISTQPAKNGGKAEFHPYPFVYSRVLAKVSSYGVPYRMTEANDCLHGVTGASDGFAAALWALDYMHWWAVHHMAGVNFHNNPWIPTDTVVPDPNPCAASGCGNYRVSPKAYGMKAFALGSEGYVEPVSISNPDKLNLTAYAVGTNRDVYVTIINKTHSTTHDTADAAVTIQTAGFKPASAEYIVLTDGEPGNAARMTATLGGASITNDTPWAGSWTPIGHLENGRIAISVQSTTAVVIRIHGTQH
jgi:hypothetical protein